MLEVLVPLRHWGAGYQGPNVTALGHLALGQVVQVVRGATRSSSLKRDIAYTVTQVQDIMAGCGAQV